MKTDLTENLLVGSKTTEKHGIGGNEETENSLDRKQKSILIIDTPKTCEECDCHLWKVCVPADEDIDEYVNPSKTKPEWCPLKPLPSKGYGDEDDFEQTTYFDGWNDCLEEITGETE